MKKLKLRKEVKFITASIALGLTLCAVPTMKVIAEDDSIDTSDLYTRLMAAETLEEFEEIAYSATEEEIALLTEEQNNDIQAHYDSFEVNEIVANDVIITESFENQEYDDINQEEEFVPITNVCDVAPLIQVEN